jgi:hypothetical protein
MHLSMNNTSASWEYWHLRSGVMKSGLTEVNLRLKKNQNFL